VEKIRDADVVLKETSPWLVFRSFTNKKWLVNATKLALTFLPKCILPAGLGLIAMSVWLVAIFIVMSRLSQINEMTEVLTILISAMVALVLSAITYLWSIALWLARLTAVSRAVLSLPESDWSGTIDSNTMVAHMKEAIAQVKERKGFMTKYYLLITLYMLAPLVCLFVCTAVVLGPKLIVMPGLVLPQWFETASMLGLITSAMFIFVFSMISLVVSSSCKTEIQKSVYKTIGLSINCFLPCLVLSLITVAVLTLTTEPLSPFLITQAMAPLNSTTIAMMIINFLWQSAVSIFILPLMVIPFSELLRGRFE
jgi:hypothetical protein